MSEVTDIRKPDRICIDCGKMFLLALARVDHSVDEDTGLELGTVVCPRCSSPKHQEYVEAEHQQIEINVPEGWAHPFEERARAMYERIAKMTGWRESKIRLWFQLPNPLLGNVPPEVMIMAGEDRCARLEKFIEEAEELNEAWHERAAGDNGN